MKTSAIAIRPLVLLWALASLNQFSLAQDGRDGQSNGNGDLYLSANIDNFPDTSLNPSNDVEVNNWLNSDLHAQLGLSDSDELKVTTGSRQILDYTIKSVQQNFAGLPVIGNESRLVLDSTGQVVGLQGKHQEFGSARSQDAQLTFERAAEIANVTEIRSVPATPVYLPVEEQQLRLVWQIEGLVSNAGNAGIEQVYVDAVNGDVLRRVSRVYSAMERKVMDMEFVCKAEGINGLMGDSTFIELTIVAETEDRFYRFEGDGDFGTDHVDEVYQLLGDAYYFINTVLNLDGLDDNGVTMEAFAGAHYHYQGGGLPQCIGDVFNASWFGGAGWNEMYIPTIAIPYIEVLVHELTHGIIDFGSDLVYQYESGALNEAIADAIGVSFRAWTDSGGRLNSSPSSIQISPAMWRLREPSGFMRDMQSPSKAGDYPDHYGDFYQTSLDVDNGGVHTNSSIINQAFYVLVVGGQHPRLGIGPSVQGIGVADAARIFGEAASKILTPYSDFEDARNGFAMAAELIHGKGSAQWVAVHESMDVVGIPGSWEMPPLPIEPEVEPEIVEEAPLPEIETTPTQTPAPQAPPISTSQTEPQSDMLLYVLPALVFLGLAIVAAVKLRPQYDANEGVAYGFASSQNALTPQHDQGRQSAPAPPDTSHMRTVGQLSSLVDDVSLPLIADLMLSKEGLVIGRAGSVSHLVLEDRHISRRHLRLSQEKGIVFVEDLNSSHGSSIDGIAITPFKKMALQSGQLLRLAGISFRIDLG